MSIVCTRCEGTGFLNAFAVPVEVFQEGIEAINRWIPDHPDSDVTICDCCGDGEDHWHGLPGEHYTTDDPIGKDGPYAYNGGLCECH